MTKKKVFELSIINKTHTNNVLNTTHFYTSDTALELVFRLLEKEYVFDSAEVLLLNVDDRSLVTRSVNKFEDQYSYELDDNLVAHYGNWKGQLQLKKGAETYVSSPFSFRIENDLQNNRPPQLTEVNNWKNLRAIADGLIADIRSELELVAAKVSEIDGAETTRQQAESQRQSTFETNETERKTTFETAEQERQSAELIRIENENQRNLTSVDEFIKLQDAVGGRNYFSLSKLSTISASFDWVVKSYFYEFYLEPDTNYIMSSNVPNDGGRAIYFNENSMPNAVHLDNSPIVKSDENGYLYVAIPVGKTHTEKILDGSYWVKLEKGNKATDWTPAPEDYTVVSKDDYFNHIKSMNEFKDSQFNQLKQAVIALGGTI